MAFVSEIEARLKADNSDFRQKMMESEQGVERFDKQLKKFGLGFGGVAALVTGFRAIVDHARDLEGPLDANQKRAQQFAKDLDAAKKGMLDVGVSALGVVNGLGEWLGRQAAILWHGREQVEIAERIEKQTQETLAVIERDKKITEEVGKIRKEIHEIEKRRGEEAVKQLSLAEQLLRAEVDLQASKEKAAAAAGDKKKKAEADLEVARARTAIEKVRGEIEKRNADEKKKADEAAEKSADKQLETYDKIQKLKFDAKSLDERILELQTDINTETEFLKLLKKGSAMAGEVELGILEKQAVLAGLIKEKKAGQNAANKDLLQTETDLKKLSEEDLIKQADLVEARIAKARAEGLVTEEMEKQLGIIRQIIAKKKEELDITFKIRGRADEDLSERVLEDKVRNLTKSIQAREFDLRNFGGATSASIAAGGAYDPLLSFERGELDRAQRELAARRRTGALVERYGEDGAQRFFRGNIPEFERLLQFVNPQGEAKRTADALTEINERLKNSGLFPRR